MARRSKKRGFHCPRCGGLCRVKHTEPGEENAARDRKRQCYDCELKFPSREVAFPPTIDEASELFFASVRQMRTLWSSNDEKELLSTFLAKFPEMVTRLEEIDDDLTAIRRKFRTYRDELKQVEQAAET